MYIRLQTREGNSIKFEKWIAHITLHYYNFNFYKSSIILYFVNGTILQKSRKILCNRNHKNKDKIALNVKYF